ncbi:FaeA/PapI family transcriptional regulator [Ruficoccus sp. ZRK36]|nr:FaeA/PapI family transcriptional regulator [Ruficoccus sp. ZRK36]
MGAPDQERIDEIGQILARGIMAMHLYKRGEDSKRIEIAKSHRKGGSSIEQFLASHAGPVTCSAVADYLGVCVSSTRNLLNVLVQQGKVRRLGKGPATRYQSVRD